MSGHTDESTLASSTESALRHESVSCSGPPALAPLVADLAADALRADLACYVLVGAAKTAAVKSALGADAGRVAFFDLSVHGRNPARVLPAVEAFVRAHPEGARVVAEPFHAEQSSAARAEAELAELALGLAEQRTWPAHVVCVHDEAVEVPASFGRCHESTFEADEAKRLIDAVFATALPLAPTRAKRFSADLTTLRDMRREIESFARTAGLGGERTDDLVYAVNEVVTNSICHGEGRATVTVWADADAVLCDVADRGRIADPLVGRVAPADGQLSGRGLWLVNQLCDLVQVRSGRAGAQVRMSVDF